MKTIRWGILSTGTIAHTFARTISEINDENSQLYAVGSRSLASAESFAKEYNILKAYATYEELVADPDIDIIYVATPHNFHYENMKLCLENGKNIMCEKSFTTNADQAEEIFKIAQEKNLFVMEAFWTKFIPVYREVESIIAGGILGDIKAVTAQYGYKTAREERKFDPNLAGGALLDIGVYNIGFTCMILGYKPNKIATVMQPSHTGTDRLSAIILEYDNSIAQITTAIGVEIPYSAAIYGTKGHMIIPKFKDPSEVIINMDDGSSRVIAQDYQSTGFEFQIREAENCLRAGKIYSEIMNPDQTIAVMEIMDGARESWQMTFPFEQN